MQRTKDDLEIVYRPGDGSPRDFMSLCEASGPEARARLLQEDEDGNPTEEWLAFERVWHAEREREHAGMERAMLRFLAVLCGKELTADP
ncbi:MAG: hypothetical protein HY720_02345 [Planctomycetes bacterium]|nr:hypothetical protein [Planctomycetota bacterium]